MIDPADKAIATTRQSFHKPGRIGGIAQSFTEFVDRGAETMVEIDDGVGRPKALGDFLASDYLSWALQKNSQELERLAL